MLEIHEKKARNRATCCSDQRRQSCSLEIRKASPWVELLYPPTLNAPLDLWGYFWIVMRKILPKIGEPDRFHKAQCHSEGLEFNSQWSLLYRLGILPIVHIFITMVLTQVHSCEASVFSVLIKLRKQGQIQVKRDNFPC